MKYLCIVQFCHCEGVKVKFVSQIAHLYNLIYYLLSPHADRRVGDILFTVCLFVHKHYCNRYL